jgi:hypothetical protein
MFLVLSGEGPTDLGGCSNAQGTCSDADFSAGVMTVLADQIIEPHIGYSLRSTPCQLIYVGKAALCERLKALPGRLRPTRGKKQGVETRYFFDNAAMLGRIALGVEAEREDTSIAILFRDCDSSEAHPPEWDAKFQSMLNGFQSVGFERGVPMIPKPTSEVWLLAAAQSQPYQNCIRLEELPGNIASPNHPKIELDEAFGEHKSAQELCEWLDDHPYDHERACAMPSFSAFKHRLESVIETVLHH